MPAVFGLAMCACPVVCCQTDTGLPGVLRAGVHAWRLVLTGVCCVPLCMLVCFARRCAPQQHQALCARQGPQVREGSWSQEEPRLQGVNTQLQQQQQHIRWGVAAAAAAVAAASWSSGGSTCSLLVGCWCVVARWLCVLQACCHT